MSFDSAKEYVEYLKDTLIPDLKESKKVLTAKDFEKVVKLISSGKTDASFFNYLRGTLIPDLKEDGQRATAEDFEEGIYWIKANVGRRFARIARRVEAATMRSFRPQGRSPTLLCTVVVSAVSGTPNVVISPTSEVKNSPVKALLPAIESYILEATMVDDAVKFEGEAEIGSYEKQEAWSDQGYIAVWSSNPKLANILIGLVRKYVKLQGGGVPGSNYTPSGRIEGSGNTFTYNYSSFGIGD